jgi:polyhydroxyalkanoate synthesis regulator phasin
MKQMYKLGIFVLAMVLVVPVQSWAAATQVDSLIQKLVDKGILDKQEARELKMEIAEDAKVINEDAAKAVVPDWVKNTKIKGDVRVRYQYERRANDTESRTRGRSRFRLGLENTPAPQWKLGAGLASAAVDKNSATTVDDPRSTNVSFEDSFSRGTIRLDYAFAEYKPIEWAKIIAGKYSKTDYLWTTSDMLWDTDINPAGASVHLDHKFNDFFSGFANAGAWVIDENNKADRVDPFVMYSQAGLKAKEGMFDATVAGVYYGFNGVKGATLDATQSSNTLVGSVLKYDYDSIGVAAEVGVKKPIEMLPVERLAIFADYIQNITNSIEDGKRGWAAGVKIGDEKVAGPRQWQLKYQYTSLGKDAFPDAFPDSDRLGGATDVKGNEWELQYGLTKNVSLGLDYYRDMRIKTTKNPQTIVQADLNLKF